VYTDRQGYTKGSNDLAGIIPNWGSNSKHTLNGFLFLENVTLISNLLQT
jgi:hypothetical protein